MAFDELPHSRASRNVSVNKLIEERATVMLAEFDAETLVSGCIRPPRGPKSS